MRHIIALVLCLSFYIVVLFIPDQTAVHAKASNGGTEVQGVIGADTVWSVQGSPYTITEFIHIAEGVTLTIEPGVTVQGDRSSIGVWGSISAIGTKDNPVYFSSVSLSTHTTASTELKYINANFRRVSLYGKLVIAHSVVKSFGQFDIYPRKDLSDHYLCQVISNQFTLPSGDWFSVLPNEETGCTVADNFFYGPHATRLAFLTIGTDTEFISGHVDFRDNHLKNVQVAIASHGNSIPAQIDINDNVFDNSVISIVIAGNTIIEIGTNVFFQGSTAIKIYRYVSSGKVKIHHNMFAHQEWAILECDASSLDLTILVENNNFINEKQNIFRHTGSSPLSASNNYWGSTLRTRIDEMIFDRNDSLNVPNYVTYEPYLDSPDLDSPTWYVKYLPTVGAGGS